jgi:hypothetical protein
MRRSGPAPGDFIVEYRNLWRGRGAARVVVVHLTSDAGPEELFSSSASHSGERAEGLAALWALEDGTCAWRVVRDDGADVSAQPIGIDARLRV